MMVSYTYVSRELVSKPGEYEQRDRQHKIKNRCLEWVCIITKTLEIKKKILQLHLVYIYVFRELILNGQENLVKNIDK